MGKLNKEEKLKALIPLCDDIRRKGGVEWRTAVIFEERKEYFRGKDLLRFFEQHPDKLNGVIDSDKPVQAQVEELCTLMIQQRMALACTRFYKKPHPGRKRLVKWPRKLEPLPPNQQKFDADAFYVWLEDRPISPLQYAMSILMAVVVLVACLFPVAPMWLRSAVLYLFLGLIAFIFGLLLVRFVLFTAVFTISGYEFWLFPNLVSEEVSIIEAFIPAISFEKPADGKSHLGTRIGGMLAMAAVTYTLYKYSPDEKGIDIRKAHDSILDMFTTVDNPSIGAGDGAGGFAAPPRFGNDRHIDPEKLKQRLRMERQRQKEEEARMAQEREHMEAEAEQAAAEEAYQRAQEENVTVEEEAAADDASHSEL